MKKIFCLVMCLFVSVNYIYIDNNVRLLGKVFVIDPGHGGKDNGASFNEYYEDNINLELVMLLAKKLVNEGAIVYVTRTSDSDLAPINSKKRKMLDLKERVNIVNKTNPDMFISIHLNVYSDINVNGIQVFYSNEDSKNNALLIQKQLNKINVKDKKIKKENFYLLKKINTKGVLVECGFISNEKDRKLLTLDIGKEKIINALYKGIYDCF